MEACVCPKPASLTVVPKPGCKETLGQIQRFLFQRAGHVFDSTLVDPEVPNPITALASWTPLFAASDDTKVVSSPLVENVIIPRTEAVTEGGGDNTTIDGVEIVIGANAATVLGQIAEVPGSILAALRKLYCETDLVVYMINQFGQIIGQNAEGSTTGTIVEGIPIQSFFVSDADNNGLNTRDKADIRFGVGAGWRDKLAIITPAFNAKTALWPA